MEDIDIFSGTQFSFINQDKNEKVFFINILYKIGFVSF